MHGVTFCSEYPPKNAKNLLNMATLWSIFFEEFYYFNYGPLLYLSFSNSAY